jgi:myo-inositol-1(or 4)-monophosphatase
MTPYEFAIAKVKEAGEQVLELRKKKFDVDIKGGDPRDLVTSIDIEINNFLVEAIKREFPTHGIYSEEGSGVTNASDFMWVIDPIDGTSNFARGIPHFAVCLGLLEKNIPVVGAVYNPVTRELFSFEKSKGAFLNDEPIHVTPTEELSKAQILLHAGRKEHLWEWGGESYKKLLANANKTGNLAGSALDICFIAAGRVEGVVYGALTTEDIAGAFGILNEAGGIACNSEGKPIEFSTTPQKFYAANNQKILDQLRALI